MNVEIPRRGTRGTTPLALRGPGKHAAMKAFELATRAAGMPLAYLTTVGAKTGRERVTPLRRFDEGPDSWLVVASMGGSARNPGWLHNLAAHPDSITLRIDDISFPVTAHTLQGEERHKAWQRIVAEQRQFAAYQEGTDRIIPVVRLTRRAEGS